MWSVIAAALGLALAAGGLGLPSPAHAVETIVLDDNFEYQGNGFTFLNSHGARWAQPFTPKQEGALASITVVANNTPAYEFQSAQVHKITSAGYISPDPIAGGIGELSFASHPTVSSAVNATASFPQRPPLTVGAYYALVVDPRVADPATGGWTTAAFPIAWTGQGQKSYFVNQEGAMGWGSAGYTGQVHFSVRLALPVPDAVITPQDPVFLPSTKCDVPGTVTIPVQDGVEFSRVDTGTDVTVSARPLPGFVFEADAQTSWVFSIAAEKCQAALIEVVPLAPTVAAATCDAPGTVTSPRVAGVVYSVSGPIAQTTVTAIALPGYEMAAGAPTTWSYDLSPVTCGPPATKPATPKLPHPQVDNQLANTGFSDLSGWLPAAALLALLGVGLMIARARSRRSS